MENGEKSQKFHRKKMKHWQSVPGKSFKR